MSSTPADAAGTTGPLPAVPARRGWRSNPHLWFWIFTGPFFAGLLIFTIFPIIWSIYLSFFEARNTVTPTHFVGLENYTRMLSDPAFRSSLLTFVVFAAFIVPTTFALSLGLAVLVNSVRAAQAFFRSVFFLPIACSYVAAALIWRNSLFSGVSSGLVNSVLGLFGKDPVAWLSVVQPPWYWLVITTVRLWLQVGFYMVLFLAALQRIPRGQYEAAALDGAVGWKAFRYITFPQLRATSTAVLMLLLVNAFQAFDEFYNLMVNSSGTYPPYARPPLVYLYNIALGSVQDFGNGSAGAVILTLIIAIFALLQGRLTGLGRRSD
ncbi:carbohydrate ABC transporter membrane protein 1 (CUT1 family) [Branchiibius hedensis]|uniref:Carbohydrate ABC transporter membrane protein 1, CUT1 family n=1 Tax=Branchiibius hedensis TaxID=672460 RepID=A0A2Y8ZUP6_9MICO|nr:sugar ABC transporter permease [Branchiibius hedensis]PWJ24770.1 carbohydrate ABC transporter membrane protein 1 (CUT1 family) [Branchiibius hedensis]SSA33587.1 carbohydrate ABC transporter membrane protein 1, CUT1 family [Branchiibius hedensis]